MSQVVTNSYRYVAAEETLTVCEAGNCTGSSFDNFNTTSNIGLGLWVDTSNVLIGKVVTKVKFYLKMTDTDAVSGTAGCRHYDDSDTLVETSSTTFAKGSVITDSVTACEFVFTDSNAVALDHKFVVIDSAPASGNWMLIQYYSGCVGGGGDSCTGVDVAQFRSTGVWTQHPTGAEQMTATYTG
jgi:hypothetical protein